MKTLKTITGEEITIVSSNKRERTYTLKTKGGKFRTNKMSKQEFESCQHNTGNDWYQFLRSNDYSKV